MALQPRSIHPSLAYHVINRAAARHRCFHKYADDAALARTLDQAVQTFDIRFPAY